MKVHARLPDQDLGKALSGDAQVISEKDNARLQCVLYTQLKYLRRALDNLAARSSIWSVAIHGDQAAAVAAARMCALEWHTTSANVLTAAGFHCKWNDRM